MRLIENWFSERYSDNLQLSFRVKDQLMSVKTDYQRIDVFDTYDYGKLLAIDGTVQMCEYDEFVYHEMITLVPLHFTREQPRKPSLWPLADSMANQTELQIHHPR